MFLMYVKIINRYNFKLFIIMIMKTKIKNISKYIIAILFFSVLSVQVSNAALSSSDWLVPMTAWVDKVSYEVEWCTPHTEVKAKFLSPINGKPFCQIWKFDSSGKIVYDWTNFLSGTLSLNPSYNATRTAATWIADIFNMSDLQVQAEWTFIIRIILVDYAKNISKFQLKYKVDKTAPQIELNWITENNPYIHVSPTLPRITWIDWTVLKYDSLNNSWTSLAGYLNPTIWAYIWDAPVIQNNHTRQDLYTLYFQNHTSWSWSAQPFSLNLNYSDNYNWALEWWTEYISDVSKFELFDDQVSNIFPITSSITLWTSPELLTSFLINNNDNTQKKYRLRLYDNTVWNWATPKPNYSEVVFYAVKDNTPPNMWWNSLAATYIWAVENVLKYWDWNTVFDKNAFNSLVTASYDPITWSWYSRFIVANDTQPIVYNLSDIWITWYWLISWTTTTWSNEWYNAWINTNNTLIKIEDAVSWDATPFTNFSSWYINSWIATKDFSLVSTGSEEQNWYRKYSTQFISNNGATEWLCDNVNNCLTPKLEFRVVANKVDVDKSEVKLIANAWVDWKLVANWSDYYSLSWSLRDIYNNKVVPVKSTENLWALIKDVEVEFDFINWLKSDQRKDTPTWTWMVSIIDTQVDNNLSNTVDINNTWVIKFKENPSSTPNGEYSFKIASKVPTHWLYPYLSKDSVLRLEKIQPKVNWESSPSIVYTTSWTGIWNYLSQTSLNWSSNLIIANSWEIWEDKIGNVANFNSSTYWLVTVPSSKITLWQLPLNKIELEYASPFVYWLNDIKLIAGLGADNHKKKLYNIDSWVTLENIYEKFLVWYTGSNLFDKHKDWYVNFYVNDSPSVWTWVIINDWVALWLNNVIPTIFSSTWVSEFDRIDEIKNNATVLWEDLTVVMEKIPSKVLDDNLLKIWFVSSLVYNVWSDNIILPSIWKNILDGSWEVLSNTWFDMSRAFFTDDYTLWSDTGSIDWLVVNGVAITWLTNKYNALTTDNAWLRKASANVSSELTRNDLVNLIKRNIWDLSSWFKRKDQTVTIKNENKWCELRVPINQYMLNPQSDYYYWMNECTKNINWEIISFFDGNVIIDCGSDCILDKRRTIVVKNWFTYIKSNISTLKPDWTQSNWQLLIWTISNDWLKNIDSHMLDTLPPDITDPLLPSEQKKSIYWWTFIDPSVTNIDAFIFSQWPMITYQIKAGVPKIFTHAEALINPDIYNQLNIFWSLLTLNNIWWSQKEPAECPYIIWKWNCDKNIAEIFDLAFMRRYKLINTKIYDWIDPWELVPFHPDNKPAVFVPQQIITGTYDPVNWGTTQTTIIPAVNEIEDFSLAKKAWWLKWREVCTESSTSLTGLRCISDPDYHSSPMLIERDLRWNKTPSVLFRNYKK